MRLLCRVRGAQVSVSEAPWICPDERIPRSTCASTLMLGPSLTRWENPQGIAKTQIHQTGNLLWRISRRGWFPVFLHPSRRSIHVFWTQLISRNLILFITFPYANYKILRAGQIVIKGWVYKGWYQLMVAGVNSTSTGTLNLGCDEEENFI